MPPRTLAPAPLAELLALGLCCPRCRGDLSVEEGTNDEPALRCAPCAVDYPVILGIPDLRVFPDPYIGIEEDRAKGRRLAAYGAGRRWQDLAAHYYDITLDTVPAPQARRFEAGLHAAHPRAESALESWDDMAGAPLAAGDRLLEVGCGTAPLLAAVGSRVAVRVGVDIAFRWLVVGQLRLANAGVPAHLVCACAEALPFRDAAFDVYATQGTLENVRDQSETIAEANRVLRDGGSLLVSTANRFSLGPDPHLGIPMGGLVPPSLASAWARRSGALPPQRNLLSLSDLTALLRRGRFERARYDVPAVPIAQRAGHGLLLRIAARVYELARAHATRSLLFLFGPTLVARAEKPRG